MRSRTKKGLLLLACSLATIVLAGGIDASTKAVAETEMNVNAFEMMDGASIRVSEPTGVRFRTKLGSTYYNELTQPQTTAQLRVALIPYTYYAAYQADATKGNKNVYPWLVDRYGKENILDVAIPAENLYQETDETTNETYYCANAVITEVYFNNYHRDFVGVAYIQRGTEGNYTYEDTTNVTESAHARNIFEVACSAYENPEVVSSFGEFLDTTIEKGMYYAYGVRYNGETQTYEWNEHMYTTYTEVQSALGTVVNQATVALDDVVMELTDAKTLNATVQFSDGTPYTQNAYCTWKVQDETIATVDANGVVTAKKGGQTTVTVSALGGKITDTCILTVREDVVTDYNFLAQGDAGITASNTGNANIELSDTQINADEITQVLCGETPVTFTVNGTVLTLTDAPAGDQVYTIVTPFVDYTVNACVYGYSISNKAEFLAWRDAVSKTGWPGFMSYTILTANINLAGETLSAIGALDCVLDGRGYAIANFTLNECSLFTTIGETGAYKNLQIIGATQTWGTTGGAHGIFAQMMYGTIEDVYVQATITGLTGVAYSAVLVYGGNSLSTLKNIIADITVEGTHTYFTAGVNWGESAKAIDNVHMLVNSAGAVASGSSSTNSGIYSSTADLANATQHFASPWIVKEGQVPYLREKQTVVVDGEFLAKGDAEITAMNTGNAVLDLSQTTIAANSITKVLCNGENIAFSANANSLTLKDAPAGENTYTLVGALENYTVKVCVYGYAIANEEEFIVWRNSAEDIRAYTILTADIDLAGESFAVANRDLSCILDGRGHTVANFTLNKTSLFTNVTWLGGYKNLQLINVTQSWEEADGGWGILAKMMYGSAENILIKGNISGLGSVMHSGVLFYGGSDTTSVKNIIAELTTDGTGTYFVAGVNWGVAPSALDNIHLSINATAAMTYGAATATNSGIYSSTADLANATKDFGAPWIVQSGKVPYLSDYSRFLNNN